MSALLDLMGSVLYVVAVQIIEVILMALVCVLGLSRGLSLAQVVLWVVGTNVVYSVIVLWIGIRHLGS